MFDLAQKLQIAHDLTQRGLGLFLVKPRGKAPLEKGWQQTATSNFDAFRERLEAQPDCNIGVATGSTWNVFVMDIDPRHGGDESLKGLLEENGPLPNTLVVRTGGGGEHYYFSIPRGAEIKCHAGEVGDGIDIRGEGGLVVGPGSEHESGGFYEIASAPAVLAEPPAWLLAKAADGVAKTGTSLVAFKEGNRNNNLTSIAGSLRRKGLEGEAIDTVLQAVNSTIAKPLAADEVTRIAQSVSRYDPAITLDFTERSLADAFARYMEGQIVRISEGGWADYRDGLWRLDPSGSAALICQEAVKAFVARIEVEAVLRAGELEREAAEKMLSAAKRCQSANVINHIVRLAASDPALLASSSDFDADPDLLNLRNGVLNLRTGQLVPHDPNLRLMKQADVEFDPTATCPLFDQFLSEILDRETADFLMQAFAYSLLGSAERQLAFVLIGSGLNGKTTLANVIRGVIGDYGLVMDPSSLLRRDSPSVRSDIARLYGARTVFTSEFAQGSVIDSPLIKRLTGNETITARHLYKEDFEFACRGVFFLTTNHPPVIDGSDYALARRVCVVPFERRIHQDQVDPELENKLAREKSGILNRLLEGLQRYRREKLAFPELVRLATDKYVAESDLIGEFLRQSCSEGPGYKVGAEELHQRYQGYCAIRGTRRLSAPVFKRALESKGYLNTRTSKGVSWEGLKLESSAKLFAATA